MAKKTKLKFIIFQILAYTQIHCYENEKIDVNSENQFVNEINKRRKKWNFFPPNSEFNKNNNDNTTNSSSNSSSSNELNDNVTVFKPKQLHKNINQKIQAKVFKKVS